MRRSFILFLAFALTIAFVIGCSSGGGSQLTLPQVDKPAAKTSIGTHLWGTYQIMIDKNTSNVDIAQLRGADQIINVLGFLEPPALVNLSIDFDTLIIDFDNNYIGADVILRHPIPDPVFMGFDVRGVVFGPDLLNADGLTPVMNPADFADEPFGYMNGLLGAPDSYAHYDGLWGYKYFCDGLGYDDDVATYFSDEANLATRGVFRDGSTNIRHYDLSWIGKTTPLDFLVFNYAVYANYDWPVGEAPIDIDDFSPTANCSEAFCFKATEAANTLYYVDDTHKGGRVSLDVEVWDWQAIDSTEVDLEGIAPTGTDPGTTSKSKIFHFVDYDPGTGLTTNAGLDLTIKATDPTTFGEAWFMGLLSTDNPLYGTPLYICFPYKATVSAEPPPAGLKVKISGPLPPDVTPCTAREFCVIGDSSWGYEGVYYWGDVPTGYDELKYPLDYSTNSSLYVSMSGPWWNPGITPAMFMGPIANAGPIEITGAGGCAYFTWDTGLDPFWGVFPNRFWWEYQGPNNGSVLQGLGWYYYLPVDNAAEDTATGTVWGNEVWDGTSIPSVQGIGFKFNPPYDMYSYQFWGGGYFPQDTTSSGVDGAVSWKYLERVAVDDDPNHDLVGGASYDIVWYYLEQDPGNPDVEVMSNSKVMNHNKVLYTIDDEELNGAMPIDLSTMGNWGAPGFEDSVMDWLALLEDNGDGTWTVSVWEWDGTTMNLIDRAAPITGTPYTLDCDAFAHEIHVWADEYGVPSFYVLGF